MLLVSHTPPCRAVNSSWRTILSSSLISSGTRLSTPLRKMADGCCATWFATSSPRTSWSSPAVWAKGSARSTQEIQAWRDGRSTPSKSAASEVRGLEKSVHLEECLFSQGTPDVVWIRWEMSVETVSNIQNWYVLRNLYFQQHPYHCVWPKIWYPICCQVISVITSQISTPVDFCCKATRGEFICVTFLNNQALLHCCFTVHET